MNTLKEVIEQSTRSILAQGHGTAREFEPLHDALGREVREERPKGNRHQEQGLKLAIDRKVEQHRYNEPHHQHLPGDLTEARMPE